jgi:hypothetical protein
VFKNRNDIMKSMALSLLAVGGIALMYAPAARAGEQDFTLHNKTGVEIHALHVSPHSASEWGEDILGQDTLAVGASLEIKFGRREKAAKWDLRIEDDKGNSLTWENLNLLEISEVTLHFKDGKAWADTK